MKLLMITLHESNGRKFPVMKEIPKINSILVDWVFEGAAEVLKFEDGHFWRLLVYEDHRPHKPLCRQWVPVPKTPRKMKSAGQKD